MAILVVASQPARLRAQTDTEGAAPRPDDLRAAIVATEAASDLENEAKTAILATYRKALALLESAAASEEAAERFRHNREEAPERIRRIRATLDRSPTPVTLAVEAAAPSDIEQALARERADLAATEAKLDAIENELATQRERPAAIRTRVMEARRRLAEVDVELKTAVPAGGAGAQTTARRAMLAAEAAALNAEVRMLDEELLSHAAGLDLLQAQRDELAQRVEGIAEREKRLSAILADRRRSEREEVLAEAQAARREAADKHPLVRQLVERNAKLTEEIAEVTAKTDMIVREESATAEQAKRIGDDFRSVRQKLEVAGLSQALGMILLDQRRALPDRGVLRKRASVRENEIAITSLRQIHREDEQRELRNLDGYAARLTEHLTPTEREAISGELKELVKTRRELLNQAIDLDRAYLRALGNLEVAQRQLTDAVEGYGDYLAGRLIFDDYYFFRTQFEEHGVFHRTVMFVNQASDPIVERLNVADMALAVAERFAVEQNKRVLVLLTDMTAYADAMKEIGVAQEKIPATRGYMGDLYTQLARRYEKACDYKGAGSVTILTVTTMPGDDVTHPVPDNTGYITEGQFYLHDGVIDPFGSLSRLKQHVIGKVTREDHGQIMNAMVRFYSSAKEAEQKQQMSFELSDFDQKLLRFGRLFRERFMRIEVALPLEEALDLSWKTLAECFAPEELLMKQELIDRYYPRTERGETTGAEPGAAGESSGAESTQDAAPSPDMGKVGPMKG